MQNKKNVIVCVLSVLEHDPKEKEPVSFSFSGKTFDGIQTNVAPVKCLIDKWCDASSPVEIECLCSDECDKPIQSFGMSTFEYFDSQIQQYCQEKGLDDVVCNPIAYDFGNPNSSIAQIINCLEHGSRIHIDLTGGGRDAAVLLTLTSQLLKMQDDRFELGDILYANHKRGAIIQQNTTFEIIDLINAVNAFINYAQTDQLCAFFRSRECSPEIEKLCSSLSEMTEALTLCQVNDIQFLVKNVQENLANAREAITAKTEAYCEAQQELDMLKFESTYLNEEEVARYQATIRGAEYSSAEVLFSSLIPDIENTFVQKTETAEDCIKETIRWCTKHQLIQQALCIYREHISEYLIEKGIVSVRETLDKKDSRSYRERTDVLKVAKIYVGGYKIEEFRNKGQIEERYLEIQKEGEARCALIWGFCLLELRNRVMHSQDSSNTLPIERARAAFPEYNAVSNPYSVEGIRAALINALDSLDSHHTISNRKWKKMLEKTKYKGIRSQSNANKFENTNNCSK